MTTPVPHAGDAAKRIIAGYGFWLFLVSDIIMFSAFFAAHAVLATATAGGPAGRDLLNIRNVAIETGCLLLSSFSCGIASIGARAQHAGIYFSGMAITLLLGAAFLGLEAYEFAGLVARGAGPARSAFLSSFFALVGCHGLHVTLGMVWLMTMMAQVAVQGFPTRLLRRQLCFGLFWHTIDIVWVALFSVVYLIGTLS